MTPAPLESFDNDPSVGATVLTEDQIAERIAELGVELTADYRDERPLLVCVLRGAYAFLTDLARHIDLPVEVDFIAVSSYGASTRTSGVVRLVKDLDVDLTDRHVVLVEDIVDTGLTIAHLLDLFRTRKPASLKVCALLHKPSRTRIEVPIDYLGFTIEDKFVVGYGLDFAQRYRNLPFIGIVEHA